MAKRKYCVCRLRSRILIRALMAALFAAPSAPAQRRKSTGGTPAFNASNFRTPPLSVRPLYRWWLPLAATDDDQLRCELDEMLAGGAGGVEVDGMPVPGRIWRSIDFLAHYGFGTPLWSEKLATIFRAANT